MGLSTPARAFLWGDGLAVAGQDLRLQATSALLASQMSGGSTGIAARQGVRPSGLYALGSLSVSAASGMNITVNSGMAFVQGTTATDSGIYTVAMDATGTITVATSDPTNPRIDNVIVQVIDLGTSGSTAVITLQTGTPAPSPAAPALPANSLLLATVAVAANTSSIVAGNITDQRQFTVANGGIVPISTLAAGAAMIASNGQFAFELTSGRLRQADGSGHVIQPKIAAYPAAVNGPGSNFLTNTSSFTTAISVSITAEGTTEFEVWASWLSLTPGSGSAAGDFITLALYLDGSGFGGPGQVVVRADSTSLNSMDGGVLRAWTVPSAGSHTLSLVAQSTGHAFTINSPYIRVAPSLQQ